jgi:hypothetical protein
MNPPGLIHDCGGFYTQDIHLYNNDVYINANRTAMGVKGVCGLYILEPEDMTLNAQYTSTTSPGYNEGFVTHGTGMWQSWGAGKYLTIKTGGMSGAVGGVNSGVVVVVSNDGVSETLTEYVIGTGGDLPTWSLDENVAIEGSAHWASELYLMSVMIDASRDRMYCYFYDAYIYSYEAMLGYIDLTESPDAGTGYYTFTELWRDTSAGLAQKYGMPGGLYGCGWTGCTHLQYVRYCKEDDVIIGVHGGNTTFADGSPIIVWDAQTGVIQFAKSFRSDPNIPYYGLRSAYVYDNKIYGAISYTTYEEQGTWRGLYIYDMLTNSKQTVRPGYATQNNYAFYDYDFADIGNGYIWIGGYDGAFRYHIGNQFFEHFTDETIPGLGMGDAVKAYYIAYDTATGDVWISDPTSYADPFHGLRRFNVNGDYRKGQYQLGTKIGTDLGLSNQQDLTVGYFERNIVSTVDEDDILWAVWEHVDNVESDVDLYWDHDMSENDVSDDLTDVVEIAWDIEAPSELRFYVANGHLYDQQNSLSTYSYLFVRGRKIIPKLGEKINGSEYLVQQGVFIVEEVSMKYGKGEHPVLEVTCRDISALWEEHRIVVTDYYDGLTPKVILEELFGDWTVMEGAEFSIPNFETSHLIWHQWQDETLYDIVKMILDHFEYVFYFDHQGVFAPKRLEFDKPTDHIYGNQLQIQDYSPDSTFSTFINQIRVIGETHDFMEIVYDPEQVGVVNGTCGWWDQTIYHTVYYNEERTRKCRNPYLVVNVSTNDFEYFIFKGGGGERISYIDPEELYCIIEVQGPNLIPVVVALTLGFIALGAWAYWCDGFIGGWCGVAIMALCVNINLLCYALLAVATYDFEIWAMPVGKQKQTVQYVAEDTHAMSIINMQPVMEEIEDPLCYEVSECQRVAEYELSVIAAQRERIKLRKLAHLQDEIHDMLRVKHPHSGQNMYILVANLVRTLVIKGEMTDSIEGWRIS